MLVILFFLLCTLAIIHFLYERIILPEIRLYYRNELFVLRDKVRDILLNEESRENEKSGAAFLHNALNNSINRLHYLTISNRIITAKVLSEQPELRSKIQNQIDLIKKSENLQLYSVFNECCIITNKMFMFNSLFALIYLIPIILFVNIIMRIFKFSISILDVMCDRKKEAVEALSFSSDKQFNKIVANM